MAKFRKKPVVIEAIRCASAMIAARSDRAGFPPWLESAHDKGDVLFESDGMIVRTLEGTMRADPEDYIICGIKGELYPCKPDIFAATYEPAE